MNDPLVRAAPRVSSAVAVALENLSNLAARLAIARAKHGAHPSGADLAQDLESAGNDLHGVRT